MDQAIIEPIDPELLQIQLHSFTRISQTVSEELIAQRNSSSLSQQLSALISAIPLPLAVIDSANSPLASNQAFSRFLTGEASAATLNAALLEELHPFDPMTAFPTYSFTFALPAPFNGDYQANISPLQLSETQIGAVITISDLKNTFVTPPYVSALIKIVPTFALQLTNSPERTHINAFAKLKDSLHRTDSGLQLDSAIQSLIEILDEVLPAELSVNLRHSDLHNQSEATDRIIQILTNLIFFAAAAISFRGDIAVQVQKQTDGFQILLRAVPEGTGLKNISDLLDTHAATELALVNSIVSQSGGDLVANASDSAITIDITIPEL